ncbi:hypothetical protein J7K44_02555 [bacterium]|nr:hypothetical protein [bacterium]
MTNPLLIEKCRSLRRKGFTLGEIVKAVKLPKTTIYDHVHDIILSPEAQERLKKTQQRIAEENTRRINEFNLRERKGKCALGRVVLKPENWSDGLIFLVAHFMFDGEIQSHSCIYHNRNEALINRVRSLMKEIFNLEPRDYLNKETGVHRISYYYVELAIYIKSKAKQLMKNIVVTPLFSNLFSKKIFLQAFFDDEGCVGHWRKKRLVRGFQHNLEILKLIQKLLKDFGIEGRIDEKYKEIVISRKENLIKFRDKINFSQGIYIINPHRKNSIWKKKLEKREILHRIINSYKK